MKRFIYTAIALAAVVVGCTKSNIVDVPEAQKTPIAFDTYNGRVPVTKATEITQSTISEIQVYGFHVPAGGTASYTAEPYMHPVVSRQYDETDKTWSDWGYQPLSYWPASGKLEFVAHGTNTPRAEAAAAGKLVAVEGSYANFTYTVPTAVADQQDLIAGYVAATSATSEKVSFEMNHLLARIGFTLKTLGTGADVTIKAIELHGDFINTGEVNFAAENPAISTTNYAGEITKSYSLFAPGEYFQTVKDDVATEGIELFARYKTEGQVTTLNTDNSNRYMMVIPGTISTVTDPEEDTDGDTDANETSAPYIKVVYQLSGASDQTAFIPFKKADGSNWDLTAGKAYEFVLTVSVAQIDFTGSVEDWDNTTPEQPIY